MSAVLRAYDPAECDSRGVPLDWERCRCQEPLTHGESMAEVHRQQGQTCPTCGGHGSLKAAALAALTRDLTEHVPPSTLKPDDVIEVYVCIEGDDYDYEPRTVVSTDPLTLRDGDREYTWAKPRESVIRRVTTVRCEDCGHPMSEGTWEDPDLALHVGYVETRMRGERAILERRDVDDRAYAVSLSRHFSPCDEGCRHAGPVRFTTPDGQVLHRPTREGLLDILPPDRTILIRDEGYDCDASWRQVDVRTLGWPHDLRPEKLAVLCLRCWAARGAV